MCQPATALTVPSCTNPATSAATAREFAPRCGARIVDEVFVALGTQDFEPALRRVIRSEADGVLMFLVGSDAVEFNREFVAAGLDVRCIRFSPLMEENMLLATGAENTSGLFASAGRVTFGRLSYHGQEL